MVDWAGCGLLPGVDRGTPGVETRAAILAARLMLSLPVEEEIDKYWSVHIETHY